MTGAVGVFVAPFILIDTFVLASISFLITFFALKNAELPNWVTGKEPVARSRIVRYAKVVGIEDTKKLARFAGNQFESSALAEGNLKEISSSRLDELKSARGY